MDDISKKVLMFYPGQVVRKDLTNLLKRGINVPSFVLEYLLGVYCSTEDEAALSNGLRKVQKVLTDNFVKPEESELIKFKIRDKKSYTIIDKLSAKLSEDGTMYYGKFQNLDLNYVKIKDEFIRKNNKILGEGIWVMAKIAFNTNLLNDEENKSNEVELKESNSMQNNAFDFTRENNQNNSFLFEKEDLENKIKEKIRQKSRDKNKLVAEMNPFIVLNIKPIQMPTFDIDDFISHRNEFTTNEWIDLILRSIGISPNGLNEKEKYHMLERLVPMIEKNYNLVELGPRGTGKSYVYKEVSPYSILISGGYASPSTLFCAINRYNGAGLVSKWDVVAFDEVAGMKLKNTDVIQIMKDYMASGSFVRGKNNINADASFVFIGNINDTVQNLQKISTLFQPFPEEINSDSAFFDRIHYYLPGREVPKIRTSMLTTEYGFINDAISEFFNSMRKQDFSHLIDKDFKFNGSFNIRDEIAVRKTISGLMKLIFPARDYVLDDANKIIQYAIEGRRRVKEQLKKMAGIEFADVNLGYYTSTGQSTIVEVPEKIEEKIFDHNDLSYGHLYTIGEGNNGFCGLYRLENKFIPNTGKKFVIQGLNGIGQVKAHEAIESAWINFEQFAQSNGYFLDDKTALCTIKDMQGNGISASISVAEIIALISAYNFKKVKDRTIIVGSISLSGVIDSLKGVEDYIRTAFNAGAYYLILPETVKDEVLKLNQSIVNQVVLCFYSNLNEAYKLALE